MAQNRIERFRDFMVVLRGAWFSVLFSIVAFFAFILAPQGKDMLFSIAEQLGSGVGIPSVIALLIALFFWSVCSEFAVRMLIYLTDNSGRSLEPKRVINRKNSQQLIARIGLFFPVALLALGYLLVYIENVSIVQADKHIHSLGQFSLGTVIILVLLLLEGFLLWKLYPGGLIEKISERYPSLSWLMLSKKESDWLKKLYGMLNNIRVDLPKGSGTTGKDLPRNVLLPDGMTLPDDKVNVIPFANNPEQDSAVLDTWMFSIKVAFYPRLMKQQTILVILSFCVIVAVGFLFSVNWDVAIGATAIICMAFAAWQIIYVLLHFADKAQPIPVRLILLIWLLICSQINHDHPVRGLPGKGQERTALATHFDSAVNHLIADTATTYYRVHDSIPLIFITAEGGALRTGAFSGLMLAHLQEKFPAFRNYVFGYSSVSGGTVGSNFFNAQVIRNYGGKDTNWVWHSKAFFSSDFLSAVTAKLVFSEIINYLYPRRIVRADRAIALEKGFEQGWSNAYGNEPNLLAGSFEKTMSGHYPAVFINTTEVETGRQNIWSNVALKGLPLDKERDLYCKEDTNLSYSAAINLSDRFPLISPGGAFLNHAEPLRRHYIDGGYFENRGSETMLQVLQALPINNYHNLQKPDKTDSLISRLPIKCYVIQFNFGGNKKLKPVVFANELTEILGGLTNTRGGRGDIDEQALRKYVTETLKGEFIKLDLTQSTSELPLNWVLSGKVVNNLDRYVENMVNLKHYEKTDSVFSDSNVVRLNKLFLYHPENIRKPKS